MPYIRRLLAEMNPSPKQMTLDTLKDRSDLVEEMLELMFRGVDVRAGPAAGAPAAAGAVAALLVTGGGACGTAVAGGAGTPCIVAIADGMPGAVEAG